MNELRQYLGKSWDLLRYVLKINLRKTYAKLENNLGKT